MIGMLRNQWLLVLCLGFYGYAFIAAPERAARALSVSTSTFFSVTLLIIAVFGLIGLLRTWVGQQTIMRLLGRDSGLKGLLIAAGCGTLLIGPAYIIFPMLMGLHKQGARWAVVATVLTSYAVKVHMIPIEVGFLGWPFSLARALITIGLAFPIGLLIEWCMERSTVKS